MGRYQGRRKGRKKGGKPQQGYRHEQSGEDFIASILEQGNFKMEAYYAAQGIHDTCWKDGKLVPCNGTEEKEAERMRWRNIAGQVLPASFRIAKDVPTCLREKLEVELEELLKNAQQDGEDLQVIQKMKFLPHAYKLSTDRGTIRKNPNLAKLHEWLKQQTLAGYITRQETVSMVPPVVLSPEPSDRILDMCAAPGSKTSQLLEDLGPKGCIVANDANYQRAGMLVAQLRRIMHVNPGVLVTQCPGQFFPGDIQFDRILCDVPCTGDGTSRKNINVWQRWSQMGALAIHALQVDIAWKGVAHLLKVGGYICYSTCSFNPVENEAVVAELLRRSKGSLELVEFELEDFKTRPGWSTWQVFCEDKTKLEAKNEEKKNNEKMQARRKAYEEKQSVVKSAAETEKSEEKESSMADEPDGEEGAASEKGGAQPKEDTKKKHPKFKPTSLEQSDMIETMKKIGFYHFTSPDQVPQRLERRVRPSCFPPSEEEAKQFHLERAVRCLPQDNDTGGFFVALLRKVGDINKLDRAASRAASSEEAGTTSKEEHPTKRAKTEESGDIAMEVYKQSDNDGDNNVEDDDAEEADIVIDDDNNKPVLGTTNGGSRKTDEKGNSGQAKDDFIPTDASILDPIVDMFGLNESSFGKDLLMTRKNGKAKLIYYVPRQIKDLIDQGIQERLTVIGAGLKAFSRSSLEGQTMYRVCQESAHFLAPYMTKRRFVVGMDDFCKCLTDKRHVQIDTLSEPLQAKLLDLSIGSFVLVLDGYENQLDEKMVATLWRCRTDRLDTLVSKVEAKAILAKLNALQITEEKEAKS